MTWSEAERAERRRLDAMVVSFGSTSLDLDRALVDHRRASALRRRDRPTPDRRFTGAKLAADLADDGMTAERSDETGEY